MTPGDVSAHVRTQPVRVRVYARNGMVIEGFAHIKPGAYQRRVSDVLNLAQIRYLAVTDASYHLPAQDPVASACVLVNVEDVVLVDVGLPAGEDRDSPGPPLPGASA